jgi:hypothetical protein
MKDFTLGTLICCLFLAFMLGFLACHKLYMGFEEESNANYDFIRRIDSSLSRK